MHACCGTNCRQRQCVKSRRQLYECVCIIEYDKFAAVEHVRYRSTEEFFQEQNSQNPRETRKHVASQRDGAFEGILRKSLMYRLFLRLSNPVGTTTINTRLQKANL